MNHPALKGEVSINKMLTKISPRLRRIDVVSDSFSSCVSDAAKEFSRAPEMPVSKMVSQPRMFLHQPESTVSFEQLQSFTDTHSCRHLNKEMDMVNSDMEFINSEPFSVRITPRFFLFNLL